MYKVSLALAVVLALVYVFQGYYPELMAPFSNIVILFLSGMAVISASFGLSRYGRRLEKFSLVWVCFTLGMFFWFLGELSWTILTLLLKVDMPYPSIADAFRLAGYVPLLVALYLYARTFESVLHKRTLHMVWVATVILSFALTDLLMIPIVGTKENTLTLIIDLAYPFLDLALFLVALLSLIIFRAGTLGKPWALMNAGIMATVCGDILFSYATAQGIYYSGHPLDLLLAYAYMLFVLAFYVHVKEL
jgi:hypothetical protein